MDFSNIEDVLGMTTAMRDVYCHSDSMNFKTFMVVMRGINANIIEPGKNNREGIWVFTMANGLPICVKVSDSGIEEVVKQCKPFDGVFMRSLGGYLCESREFSRLFILGRT